MFLSHVQVVEPPSSEALLKICKIMKNRGFSSRLATALEQMSLALFEQSVKQVSTQIEPCLLLGIFHNSIKAFGSNEPRHSSFSRSMLLTSQIRNSSAFMLQRSGVNRGQNISDSNSDSEDDPGLLNAWPEVSAIKNVLINLQNELAEGFKAGLRLRTVLDLLAQQWLDEFITDAYARNIIIADPELFDVLIRLEALFLRHRRRSSILKLREIGFFMVQGYYLWDNFRLALVNTEAPALFEPGPSGSAFAAKLMQFTFDRLEKLFSKVLVKMKEDLLEQRIDFAKSFQNQFYCGGQLLMILTQIFMKEDSGSLSK